MQHTTCARPPPVCVLPHFEKVIVWCELRCAVECDVHTLAVLIIHVTIQLCYSPSDSAAPSSLSCVSLGPLTVHIQFTQS